MFSSSAHTSVLSPHGALPQPGSLGCPSFRLGAAGCAPPYLAVHPSGWGHRGRHHGDRILQQQEGEAGSCPTAALQRWGGYGAGREAAPIPGTTLCSVRMQHRHRPEPISALPSPSGTARAAPAGFPFPGTGGRNAAFALDSPALPHHNPRKNPRAPWPALSGQDENSPGPNSSALNTMTHWRAFV